MPYNYAADSIHTKMRSAFFKENRPFCVFEAPFGGLRATYDDDLRLIGKRVMNFLLALIELFC